ncbi:MAG: hypothetical protein ACJ71R_18725 [Nitrososphaeraceae archaeon]
MAAISIGIYRMPLQLLRNQQTSDSSHLSDKKKILEFIEENGIDDVIDEMLSVYVLHLILIQRLTLSILSYIAYILIITLFVRKSKNSKN